MCAVVLAMAAADARATQPPGVVIAEGWRRGRPVRIELVNVGRAWLEKRAAKRFLAMRDAAAADGIELGIRSGFRTFEQQRWLYRLWREGWGSKAARPGHSNHQLGRAADIYLDQGVFAWLRVNARRFGFRRTVASEPWHWETR